MSRSTAGVNLHQASAQWAMRPDDQRFTSLAALRKGVAKRKEESWTATPKPSALLVHPASDGIGLEVDMVQPKSGDIVSVKPTHWGFDQLCINAQAPASYLRELPAEMAAINIQWGLDNRPLREDSLYLCRSNGDNTLRAINSSKFGRIWDLDVVDAVIRMNEHSDGRWKIPAASYQHEDPKRATTLYASDRDVFIFLVDPDHEVVVDGDKLYRGFMTWNSEVGAATFGLKTFLYRYVCDNRIIWGAQDIKEIRIKHTGGAPERFIDEAGPTLMRYAEEATDTLTAQIRRAKRMELEEFKVPGNTIEWLRKRGFTKEVATEAVGIAVQEEGKARSLWDIVQGVTAYARSIPYTNQRVLLEEKGGELMNLAAD